MSYFMLLFKVIPYLMPFLKEMLIGKKTWTKAFKENRRKTVMAIAIIVSVLFNLVLMGKLGSLAFSYLELSRAKQELEHKVQLLEKAKPTIEGSSRIPITHSAETVKPVTTEAEPPLPTSEPSVKHAKAKPNKRTNASDIKAEFERLQRQEEIERLMLEGKTK